MSDETRTTKDDVAEPTREQQAKAALEHTAVTRRQAWVLVLAFLLLVYGIPTIQHVVDIRANLATRQADVAAGQPPSVGLLPQAWQVFQLLPGPAELLKVRSWRDFAALLPTEHKVKDYETALDENSVLTRWVMPRVQSALTRIFGLGNEQAYVGQDGWLYYRQGVDYLTSPSFYTSDEGRQGMQFQVKRHEARQSDSVKALVDFRDQLAARGIELLVVPLPVKPMIEPEYFAGGFGAPAEWPVLNNPGYEDWLELMTAKGLQVFDPSAFIAQRKRDGEGPQFLKTDTHWRPEAMEAVASTVARHIKEEELLPQRPPAGYTQRQVSVTHLGDIAEMVKFPPGRQLFPPETVTTQQVRDPDGAPWQPDPTADVLLLGDSFSNIYSLSGMGWGTGAGFAEQLSLALDRPLDKIAINAGGAYSARQELARNLARGTDRLAGKRLVVYEFAMRELAEGDWKLIKLTLPTPAGSVD